MRRVLVDRGRPGARSAWPAEPEADLPAVVRLPGAVPLDDVLVAVAVDVRDRERRGPAVGRDAESLAGDRAAPRARTVRQVPGLLRAQTVRGAGDDVDVAVVVDVTDPHAVAEVGQRLSRRRDRPGARDVKARGRAEDDLQHSVTRPCGRPPGRPDHEIAEAVAVEVPSGEPQPVPAAPGRQARGRRVDALVPPSVEPRRRPVRQRHQLASRRADREVGPAVAVEVGAGEPGAEPVAVAERPRHPDVSGRDHRRLAGAGAFMHEHDAAPHARAAPCRPGQREHELLAPVAVEVERRHGTRRRRAGVVVGAEQDEREEGSRHGHDRGRRDPAARDPVARPRRRGPAVRLDHRRRRRRGVGGGPGSGGDRRVVIGRPRWSGDPTGTPPVRSRARRRRSPRAPPMRPSPTPVASTGPWRAASSPTRAPSTGRPGHGR